MAAAAQLNLAGHAVTLYERDEAPGGLVRFGVPDFKIEKRLVQRRADLLEQEGVRFECGVDVGRDVTAEELRERFDAVVLAVGSRIPRDLDVPGRELGGVHYAMDYLYQRNRWVAREQGRPAPPAPAPEDVISAAGKHVIVIGGGDTGADCVGNAHRESAASVTQIELLGEPPLRRPDDRTPWPQWPIKLRTSYALEEGGERDFAVSTTHLSGEDGRVRLLHAVRNEGSPPFAALPGTEHELRADLVLMAMGFLGPEREGVVEQLGVQLDRRGNVKATTYAASVPGVFAAGDARRGQSLIVWAINEGRQCARVADRYMRGLAPPDTSRTDPSSQSGAAPPEKAGWGAGVGAA